MVSSGVSHKVNSIRLNVGSVRKRSDRGTGYPRLKGMGAKVRSSYRRNHDNAEER